MAGDTVQLLDVYGNFYPKALILGIDRDGYADVREIAYIPYIFQKADGRIALSAGGGGRCVIRTSMLQYVGRESRRFCDWGAVGAVKNGTLYFEADVNLWVYADENRLYGDYSTRDWEREYFSFCADGFAFDPYRYRFLGSCNVFRTELEYLAWLTTYKGVEFAGRSPNQTVTFFYRKAEHLITQTAWNRLDLPTDTRSINAGVQLVKYQYEDQSHTIHEYRYSNNGTLDDRHIHPYQAARVKIQSGEVTRTILEPICRVD